MLLMASNRRTAVFAALVAAVATTTTTKTTTNAFTTKTVVSTASSTKLYMAYPDSQRVKSSGGGIPVVPAGDRLLFDPSIEGMLGNTKDLDERLQSGSAYEYRNPYLPAEPMIVEQPPPDVQVVEAQAWLEHLSEDVPAPFAKASSPVSAKVLGRMKLIDHESPGDIQHIVLELPKGMHYVEGQSLSVIPPGVDPKTNKKYKPRLYSIASTRYGDLLDGNTVSLCVRRAEYYDPLTGLPDPAKKGVCSHYLCDAVRDEQVQVAGPVGKTMLLPKDPKTDIIMVATGTGIAPFRGFMHRLFMEETPAKHLYQGTAWLILGVPTTGSLLYKEELLAMKENAENSGLSSSLELDFAISREMVNPLDSENGGKLYVQHVLQQNAEKLFDRLEAGANIYFCGLKGMMPGILTALEEVATSKGINWNAKLSYYKSNNQWHVEVY